MNFKQWLKENNFAIADIADLLNVSQYRLYKICSERKTVRVNEQDIKLYLLVYRITGGLIAPHHLMPDIFNYEMLKEIYGCEHCRKQRSNDELLELICKQARQAARLRLSRQEMEKEIADWRDLEQEMANKDAFELEKMAAIAGHIASEKPKASEIEAKDIEDEKDS